MRYIVHNRRVLLKSGGHSEAFFKNNMLSYRKLRESDDKIVRSAKM